MGFVLTFLLTFLFEEKLMSDLVEIPPVELDGGNLVGLDEDTPAGTPPIEIQQTAGVIEISPPVARRVRLSDERFGITHKFTVNGHEGYITPNTYADGKLGEIWIVMAKEGSTISGFLDAIATATSIGLQHGVPLFAFVKQWMDQKFEPSGFTKNPDIQVAKSIIDYIARFLAIKFLNASELEELKIALPDRGVLPGDFFSKTE